MKVLIFGQIQQKSRPSWIRSVSNFAHWYIQWLSSSFLFIMYINYHQGSHKLWKFWFSAKFNKKMAASRPSYIWSISNFAHWYIQWLSTSILFIMYINYDHGSHNLWKFRFSAKKKPPVGHIGFDPFQILHTDTFNDRLQVSYSLCKWIMNSKGNILIFLWFLHFLTIRGPLLAKPV